MYCDTINYPQIVHTNVLDRPIGLLFLGKKEMLDIKTLEKYGAVKYLTLTDVFGY